MGGSRGLDSSWRGRGVRGVKGLAGALSWPLLAIGTSPTTLGPVVVCDSVGPEPRYKDPTLGALHLRTGSPAPDGSVIPRVCTQERKGGRKKEGR